MSQTALIAISLALWAAGCEPEDAGGRPDEGRSTDEGRLADGEINTFVDAAAPRGDVATGRLPDPLTDGGGDAEGDAEGDAAGDRGPDALPPVPVPPFVPGPAPERFDCRAADFAPPGRLSPVPLGCALDPSCRERMVVGHRGAGGQLGTIAPENSLYAIRAAALMGLDGVELDVRHTADGQLVLMHDAAVDRTTDGSGPVSEMTLAALQALRLQRPIHRDPDLDAAIGDFDCARPPTLAEALALAHDRLFVVLDTKTNRIGLVVAGIVAAGAIDQVFVSVSDWGRALEARRIDPRVRVQVRPEDRAEHDAILAAFQAEGLRPPEIVEIDVVDLPAIAPDVIARGLTPFADVFEADAISYATRGGDRYLAAFADGAQVLQSEFPGLVIEYALEGRPPAQ